MSLDRMAAAPLAFCQLWRISRELASFSEGEAIAASQTSLLCSTVYSLSCFTMVSFLCRSGSIGSSAAPDLWGKLPAILGMLEHGWEATNRTDSAPRPIAIFLSPIVRLAPGRQLGITWEETAPDFAPTFRIRC